MLAAQNKTEHCLSYHRYRILFVRIYLIKIAIAQNIMKSIVFHNAARKGFSYEFTSSKPGFCVEQNAVLSAITSLEILSFRESLSY